jgi:hypothetical protein
MAQNFTVNVYEINAIPTNLGKPMGFPSSNCMFLPYNGNNQALYGVIVTDWDKYNYAVVENPTQLATKANA